MPAANTATDERLQACLQQYWGYDGFRPLQLQAMRCVLDDRDSVVVLPTGGGKSLCYQVPAVCRERLAVVVSPLISLMKDQVDALRSCGVPAAFVNSTLSPSERLDIADAVRRGEIRLLYVAPERLVQDRTLAFLEETKPAFVAIDEAHCISEWGHDFRPEYRMLRMLRERLPDVSLHAYTATATERVREDIAKNLGLRSPEFLVGSFDRPNLFYRVERRADRMVQIREVMDRHPGEPGIIYCISRRNVDEVSGALNELGYKTLPYHAGMDDGARKRNQEAFIEDKIETIVATVAFGMGIDKPNVRYVIHAGMPKALENYQQESGRAGRDGLEAECVLLHSGRDVLLWRKIMAEESNGNSAAATASLDALDSYATGVVCRHKALVTYFGQEWHSDNCGACDTCVGDLELLDDPLPIGQKALSAVVRLGQRFGAHYVTLHLLGSKDKRILENGHEQLSTYGLLASFDNRSVRDWIEQLVGQGFLVKDGEYRLLKVTARGRELLRGEAKPRLLKPRRGKSAAQTLAQVERNNWEGVDRGLFDELKELRKKLADEKSVPAYVVFGDTTLREMSRCRPTTLAGLRQLRGVGDKKLADYGATFVTAITTYAAKHELPTDISEQPRRTPRTPPRPAVAPKGPSVAAARAFAHFRDGQTIAEVAEQIGRAPSTVTGYLVEFLRHEGRTDPHPWVDYETFERVREAIDAVGRTGQRPIYEHLGEAVSYEAIKLSLACLPE